MGFQPDNLTQIGCGTGIKQGQRCKCFVCHTAEMTGGMGVFFALTGEHCLVFDLSFEQLLLLFVKTGPTSDQA